MFAFALGKQQSGRFTRGPSVESSISGTPRPADNPGYKPWRGFLDQLKSANKFWSTSESQHKAEDCDQFQT